jgi:hypothetical protein
MLLTVLFEQVAQLGPQLPCDQPRRCPNGEEMLTGRECRTPIEGSQNESRLTEIELDVLGKLNERNFHVHEQVLMEANLPTRWDSDPHSTSSLNVGGSPPWS